jgi:hypothetical protein
MQPIHTIASFAKPQPDTIAAIFLLKKFGEEKFPGVGTASLAFWTNLPEGTSTQQLEDEGYLLIDLGDSKFDHHTSLVEGRPTKCSSELIAEYLGLSAYPPLQKLLAYARRDDLEGKGTISQDPLDRAFGLSGLLTNLNRTFAHDPNGVVNMVLAMFEAHYQEEENRTILVKQEWKELQDSGAAKVWMAHHNGIQLRVVQLPSDNMSMAGFLRNYHKFDMVILRRTTGHVNLITNQSRPINLQGVSGSIRKKEAQKMGLRLEDLPALTTPGRITAIPQWYYDTVANTVQNGGIRPEDTVPTSLSDDEIKNAVLEGLNTP